ncbi:hypothetical protein GCM10010840_21810 [Deinococcus aerolatus]|uniref:Amino acid permease n=1 Tax=Deinococcus aerolatus TaxID=522487 RepID=A0ABQ2GB93_9DEIO|nr:hypothetical protein [Deinococcus aerolatus]GGL83661.1 hypothetical protein GCM10010840_21810 [Deinococcus aerolatus]
MFQALIGWVSTTSVTLSEMYGVNPLVFGVLYFGTMPLFALSVAWWVRRWRRGESTLFPAAVTGLLFIAAYLYVLVTGRNLPVWVYLFMAAMLTLGGVSTWRQLRRGRASAPP